VTQPLSPDTARKGAPFRPRGAAEGERVPALARRYRKRAGFRV